MLANLHCGTARACVCVQVAVLGAPTDLTYGYEHLGSDVADLSKLASGGPFVEKLKAAKKPLVIVGPGVLRRKDRDAVLSAVHGLVEKVCMPNYHREHLAGPLAYLVTDSDAWAS